MFEADLWRRNAEHANAMATRLAGRLGGRPGCAITQRGPGQRGVRGPARAAADAVRQRWPFYTWDEPTGEARLMCSWDTTRRRGRRVRRRADRGLRR